MSDTWRAIRPGLLLAVLFSMTAAARTAAEPTPWPRLALALLGLGPIPDSLINAKQDLRVQ